VRGVELGRLELRRRIGVDAARAHEVHGLGNAVGEVLITLRCGRAFQEAQRPAVNVLEVCIAAHGKRAQQIERCRRLAVGHDLALRVRLTRGLLELDGIDDVAAIAGQLQIPLLFGIG
jgi:hypothetical protein